MATATNGHGGARENAGRKLKALRYASELAQRHGHMVSLLAQMPLKDFAAQMPVRTGLASQIPAQTRQT
jgi:hypothetical protein